MDRGVPTQATLQEMRQEGVAYLVGTPRRLLSKLEKALLERPWEEVHQGMSVKLLEQDDELYVQAQRRSPAQRKRHAAAKAADPGPRPESLEAPQTPTR